MVSSPENTVVLGCIADDHTGATDIAGLLARSGVKVNLRMGVPDVPPNDVAPFEVIALKCRNAPVAEAQAECRAALAWLQAAGARRFYWKYCSTFDSTAKGNIGPVAEALMAELDTDQTIYCPAFPENGRSIYMGNLFVGEQPLSESPMKNHPLTPMRDSNLMRLLDPQVKGKTGLANRLCVANGTKALRTRLQELRSDSVGHVVVDAVSNEDLKTIANACMDMPLLTGGSALAMFLPDIYTQQNLLSQDTSQKPAPILDNPAIILSGSCSAMTRAQVAQYQKAAPSYQLDPIAIAKEGLEPALEWLRNQNLDTTVMIYATAEPAQVQAAQQALGQDAATQAIENALAQLAHEAYNLGTRRFVIAGGETSGAITKALGVNQMTIGVEIVPGVPWVYAKSSDADIGLALKSGNFGEADFFTKALKKLEES